ncbi:MAG: HAMP domain-containing histidine kinase [Nitrospirae bacterium]|nr:HAMP domain-containing histidine kinase [Nitrospirota bacterium]
MLNKNMDIRSHLAARFLRKCGIDISIAVSQDTILLADGFQNEYKQVILNILNNSKDAITSRKETDDMMRGLIEIKIGNNAKRDKVIVSMLDNGGGIPDNVMEKIFEPYFTTKGETGTGIGLYMSKTIIETNMGGSLTIRNVNGGAEFMISMPVSKL